MDKISGIVPSSARVTTVDMTNAPGTRTTLPNADKAGVGAMSHVSESAPGSPAWKSREQKQAALVNDVSNSFFMKTKPVADDAPSSSKEIPIPHEGHLQQPDGMFPKGSFIDRSA